MERGVGTEGPALPAKGPRPLGDGPDQLDFLLVKELPFAKGFMLMGFNTAPYFGYTCRVSTGVTVILTLTLSAMAAHHFLEY